MKESETLSPFTFCVRSLAQDCVSTRYLVYSNAREFVTVNACSADEALKASGVVAPYRIFREEVLQRPMLEHNMFE